MDLEFLSSPCLNLGQKLQRLHFATSKKYVVNVLTRTLRNKPNLRAKLRQYDAMMPILPSSDIFLLDQ